MDILVCVKRVPDTETRIRIGEDGRSIDSSGVKYVMSPYDEFAVEAALRLKESGSAGEVTMLTLGDDSAQETLRSGLAMGADRAVLLKGATGMDGLATAKTLARYMEEVGIPPLVLLGVKAVDDDQQQVGAMLATLLDRPCVTEVAEVETRGGGVRCRREIEGGTETWEVDLPAVLTMTKGPHQPRYASLKGIMAAKKKPLETVEVEMADSRLVVQALEPPPDKPPGRIVGEGSGAVPELVRLLREEAKVL